MASFENSRGGRAEELARRRAETAVREYRMGLLADQCQSISFTDITGHEHELQVCLVGYVSLDVVVLTAPARLLTAQSRKHIWRAALRAVDRSDADRLVLVEHSTGDGSLLGGHFSAPIDIRIIQDADMLPALATLQARAGR